MEVHIFGVFCVWIVLYTIFLVCYVELEHNKGLLGFVWNITSAICFVCFFVVFFVLDAFDCGCFEHSTSPGIVYVLWLLVFFVLSQVRVVHKMRLLGFLHDCVCISTGVMAIASLLLFTSAHRSDFYTSKPDAIVTDQQKTRETFVQKVEHRIVEDTSQRYPAGFIDDIFLQIQADKHIVQYQTYYRVDTAWHSWFTGLYSTERVPLRYWYPGGVWEAQRQNIVPVQQPSVPRPLFLWVDREDLKRAK